MAEHGNQDTIRLEQLSLYGFHGVHSDERSVKQQFIVDLEIALDLSTPAHSDNLGDTINYEDLYLVVKDIVENRTFNLIESMAEAITKTVLTLFPVATARTRVKKTAPPIDGLVSEGISVEIYRTKG